LNQLSLLTAQPVELQNQLSNNTNLNIITTDISTEKQWQQFQSGLATAICHIKRRKQAIKSLPASTGVETASIC